MKDKTDAEIYAEGKLEIARKKAELNRGKKEQQELEALQRDLEKFKKLR